MNSKSIALGILSICLGALIGTGMGLLYITITTLGN